MDDVVEELVAALPDGVVTTDPAALEKYRHDWTHDASAGTPLAAVRAETAAQVQQTIRWAARHDIGVVPRGAGTSLSGGSMAVDGAIVLSLERMRAVEIDTAARVAVVEPGALNVEVKDGRGGREPLVPPGPQLLRDLLDRRQHRHQRRRPLLRQVRRDDRLRPRAGVVLADGRLVTLGGKRVKDVAGLSLLKLFVGSEGTLGIVTRAVLRLVPALAPWSMVIAFFPARPMPQRPSSSGRPPRRMAARWTALLDAGGFPAVGLDRAPAPCFTSPPRRAVRADEVDAIVAACELSGAKEVVATDDPEESEMFVRARRVHFTALETRGAALPEDVGVPVPQLPDLLAEVAAIAERHGVEIPVVAHAGDGNTHPAIVYDPQDADSERRARLAFDDIMHTAIRLGGTITGEHGVGRLKAGCLEAQLGPEVMDLNRRVKAALDPQGILNPGSFV